ncbi:ComEA family DNA-binding protein [Flavobacterium hercynium]|uniref:Competence protein ComEA n=1 Tax=Flavobacterium hercynium TaxID=387094 RepID=A0A226GP14_9FLAO|nr:helix-hairpin-helix domain-containing protein [Flavobacterium hercynium]OXA83812.1 hypothetical protein B0A66_21860 [Flavobacterium hercynium]SMP31409.1 DNA uptake protein ComE [Flavobacterium hercynium]
MDFDGMRLFFKFNRQQRAGVFFLLVVILVLQIIYLSIDFTISEEFLTEKEQWLSMQSEIDSLKLRKGNEGNIIHPFNPNYISDYKGYKLGLSVQEIDRLLAFRKENKYVNSAREFQEVTKVSDSLLNTIAPFFKFSNKNQDNKQTIIYRKDFDQKKTFKKEKLVVLDINKATQEDLMKIHGIGEALSFRIVKQKELLGGFVSMEQLDEVWGISADVLFELKHHFKIDALPKFKKIAINDISLKELSKFPYFNYTLAKQIITYRSMNGNFENIEDLSKIKGFPVEKAKIISLYLEF